MTDRGDLKGERKAIPKAIREKVLEEFSHRCAVCGADRPQVHHMDENPANNDPLNLLPVCPNCHLIDQHNPTRRIALGILRLFRRFKDPAILSPEFAVLYKRLAVLAEIEEATTAQLSEDLHELVRFVREMDKGAFYSAQIAALVSQPISYGFLRFEPPSRRDQLEDEQRAKEWEARWKAQLSENREQIYELIVELLRFQSWENPKARRGARD